MTTDVNRDLALQASARESERERVLKILALSNPPVSAAILTAIREEMSVADYQASQRNAARPGASTPRGSAPSTGGSSWGAITSKYNEKLRAQREAKSESAA